MKWLEHKWKNEFKGTTTRTRNEGERLMKNDEEILYESGSAWK